jgi:hypothetical protein
MIGQKKYNLQTKIYGLTLVISLLFFSHSDSIYTLIQSFGFLNGHVFDFYDFNSNQIGLTPYFPSIYAILAIWMLPLKLVNILDTNYFVTWISITPVKEVNLTQYIPMILWYKTLLLFAFFATIYYLKKISKNITGNNIENHILFATSPFAIFSVLIFSGFDIIGVLFCIIGFYFFLKKNLLLFAISFSIAISFKFFALIIFLPLLLIREKKLKNIIKYSLIAASICLISLLAFISNKTFAENVFFMVQNKVLHGQPISLYKLSLLVAYIALCINCFFQKNLNKDMLVKSSIFACYMSYLVLFFYVKWHSQWIIIILPFMCLINSYLKNKKICLLYEIAGFISFFVLTVNTWKDNVDQKMLSDGALGKILGEYQYRIADLIDIHYFDHYGINLKTLFTIMIYLYLLHPIIIYTYEKKYKK